MSDRRQWHLDLVACLLLVAGLLLCLAVLGHDPATAANAYPSIDAPHHVLGPAGAWVGQVLHETLGQSVYVLLASWFVLVVLLFLRRRWLTWTLRLAGWLFLIPTTAVLADIWGTSLQLDIIPGPGGTLGAFVALWLQTDCRPITRAIILGLSLAVGLILSLDFLAIRLVRWCWHGLRWQAFEMRRIAALVRFRPRRTPLPRPARPAKVPVDKAKASAGLPGPGTDSSEKEAAPSAQPVGIRTIPIHHHGSLIVPPDGALGPVVASQAPLSEAERFADYELPPVALLEDSQLASAAADQEKDLRERAALLEKTCADFGINVRVVGINTGPVVTQFEIALETGLRVHKVTCLGDDIALNLRVMGVRIVAPIPGKNTVGIEIPNQNRDDVRLKEVILASAKKIAKAKLPLFLGKDSEGRPLVYDLADMPHLLIAGSTGTGKSVCMNAIILSILMTRRPDEVKMVMIDPKMAEMSEYGRVPHLMHPVVTDMKKAEAILGWAVEKMEERYDLLSRARVRNIAAYNSLKPSELYQRIGPADEEERRQIPTHMPYIVILIDEMADLVLQMRKEVEGHIIRLAQKSRASGIHLVVATQRPTVDVVTGLIKSNLPARICFKVVSKSDSRVVLDAMGADKLLGRGDMLILPPGTSDLVRAQGTYASNQEIEKVVEFIETDPVYAPELMQLKTRDQENGGPAGDSEGLKARDELYEAAIEVILREGRGSVSLLQRALGIGYGRAARLVDFMAEDGIVGAYNGSSAREVLLTPEEWTAMRGAVRSGE